MADPNLPYVHGFSPAEQARLREQALFSEYYVYQNIDLSRESKIIEIGCGVGAQTEILLRRFPQLHITGVDLSEKQIKAAKAYLEPRSYTKDRFSLLQMDAMNLKFEAQSFDAAFMCWTLEHVPDPLRVLSEAKRVLKPGAKIFLTEVMNSSFFLNPYCPNLWKYWMAFSDYQYDHAGDPFVGAKLGNMLMSTGFKNIKTTVKTWHFDNRFPAERKFAMEDWFALVLSAEDLLVKNQYISQEIVDGAKKEMHTVQLDPNAVFFESFMQAEAVV